MDKEHTAKTVEDTLSWLGVPRNYRGFRSVVWAVCLAVEDEERLYAVIKEIYMATADHFGMGPRGYQKVERNIRTVIQRVWDRQPERLNQIAAGTLDARPAAAEFIGLLTAYVLRRAGDTAVR